MIEKQRRREKEDGGEKALGIVARVRASTWLSLLARVALVAAALAVLAWIGRATSAGATVAGASPDAGVASIDAGAVAPPAASPPPPSPPPAPAPPPPPSAARGRASPDDPVFVNQADETELRRLPGVGAKRAEAIVALRRRVGRFHRVEDLMRVKGIGRAAIKKWRPLVRFDAPPAPPSPDAGAP